MSANIAEIAKNVVAEYDLASGPETLAAEEANKFAKKRAKTLTSDLEKRLTKKKEAKKQAKELAEKEAQGKRAALREAFLAREKKDKAAVDALFEQWLQEVAKFWDSPAAFAADAATVHAKWRVILMRHDKTAEYKKSRDEVARTVRGGQGYQYCGNLGGDPFRDAALLVALTSRQVNARRAFDEAFKDTLVGWMFAWAKSNGRLAEYEKDFWYESFIGEIFIREVARKYRGTAGAQIFLFKPVQRFLSEYFENEQNTSKQSELAQRMLKDPSVRRYPHVADGDGNKTPYEPDAPVEFADDAEYYDSLIRDGLNFAMTMRTMNPLRRRVFRLGCGAALQDDEKMSAIAEKLGLPKHQFDALYYGAWKCLRRAFNRYDQETMAELWKRMTSGQSPEFKNCLKKIDPETGEFLNHECEK